MDPNQKTPSSSRSRRQRQEENPFFLNSPVQPHQQIDTPPNLSFTGMLQQSDHSPFPQPGFYQNPSPNPYAPQFYPSQQDTNTFRRYSQGFQQFSQPHSQSPQFYRSQSQHHQSHSPQLQRSQSHSQSQFQQFEVPSPQSVNDTIPESVPETQPEIQEEEAPSKRKHKKGKGKAKGKTSDKSASGRYKWTDAEEVALVKAWIAVSEDGFRGNAQTKEAFWTRVLEHFHALMGKGEYRTEDMLTGKWRDLQRFCTNFNGIYNNLQRQWESGQRDFDVLNAALKQYRDTRNTNGFNHIPAWRVLHEGPKWIFQRDVLTSSDSNKRSRTSVSNDYTHYSDANTRPFNLNDDVEELERPDGRDKERARDKGKQKRTGSSSRQSVSGRDEDLTYFKGVFDEHLKLKRDTSERTAMEKDLRILNMNPENAPDENREVIQHVQKGIRDRLKNLFKF